MQLPDYISIASIWAKAFLQRETKILIWTLKLARVKKAEHYLNYKPDTDFKFGLQETYWFVVHNRELQASVKF
jgi:hypothetical protein